MATSTTRLGLVKPDPLEPRSVVPLNANADKIDAWMGCILVNDGVIPSTANLFDGALVKEKTSGKIWEARKNGGGTFDRIWVEYPYLYVADTASASYPNNSDTAWGWATFDSSQRKNSSVAEQAASNMWQAPIDGIYTIHARATFNASATGFRQMTLLSNGVLLDLKGRATEPVLSASTVGIVAVNCIRRLDTGHIISQNLYQNSGGAINVVAHFEAALISPVQ